VKCQFHPEAAEEFEEAVRYYRQRGEKLAPRFAREVRSAIRRIAATPDRWRFLEEDVRICKVQVFPYSVLYVVEDTYVLLVAIMHGKRQPGYWRHRLQPNS